MLLNVKQVQEMFDVPESTAYKIIRDINMELKQKGYLTIRGRVEESYLRERFKIGEQEKVVENG